MYTEFIIHIFVSAPHISSRKIQGCYYARVPIQYLKKNYLVINYQNYWLSLSISYFTEIENLPSFFMMNFKFNMQATFLHIISIKLLSSFVIARLPCGTKTKVKMLSLG